ncbi:unnamed protein product [Cuscuta campestris]|uniref:Uncharacterized protein n=1 Tax=Cuscuta campestris TaxID=132261 RepID=A0A484L9X3_9ASTE|nr:unnamed protein product [Cuscuta campestris]
MRDRVLEGRDHAIAWLEGMLQVAKDEVREKLIKNKEMLFVFANQTNEMAKLSNLARDAEAEKKKLQEENT